MILTQKNILRPSKEQGEVIEKLCYHSARLYNVGLYSVRQYFFANNVYLPYNQNYHECKANENYKLLLSDSAQQILRVVDRNFKSFFGLLKLKQQCKYSEKINIPKYKDKEGIAFLSVQGRSARIKNGKVHVGMTKAFKELYNPSFKELIFDLPKNLKGVEKLRELRILPKFGGKYYEIEYVYEQNFKSVKLSKKNILSIDCGLDNFAACVDTTNGASFIICGRSIKAYNQWYNKTKAHFQSIYDNQGYKNTNRAARYSRKRRDKINDFLNRAVHHITEYCANNDIGTLVIGDFKGIKNEINIGKKNNQNFVNIPHGIFKRKLESRCEKLGIDYHLQEESYTSKCSFFDMETVEKHDSYCGRRVKRGLFKCSTGKLVNADINGALNIAIKFLSKSKRKSLYNRLVGCVIHPVRVSFGNSKSQRTLVVG